MPPAAAEGHGVRSPHTAPHTAPPRLLRCAVVSWYPLRGECFRIIAEQEYWQAVVCGNAKELRQCLFRDDIPLAIVDLPEISSKAYDNYRELTEWLGQLATWNGTSGMLLVVCAAGESVQEEIWARQLGTWSYLPHVLLPMPEDASMGKPDKQARKGISLLFRDAREALAKERHNPLGVTQTQVIQPKEPG